MKIVHLLKHAVRGNGSVHVAVDLACAQAALGHEVYFASARGSYDDLLRQHGVQVVPLPEPTDAKAALLNMRSLLRLVRQIHPDILHAHMMSSAAIAFPVSKLTRSTLVTTMHNSFDNHSGLMRLGKVIVAVSDAERDLLVSRGFPARKVVTVLNGTDGSAREELPLDDIGPVRSPSVITLSGLHERKAVDDVVTAFAQIHGDFPAWHLNIVGWGPDREKLEKLTNDLGISKSVHFMGSTLTPRPLLESADILATATLADPCPLTVIEARVAGCAVVGTNVGGIPEVLEHGEAGHLVPVHTPTAMAAVFRSLMENPDHLKTWKDRALQGSEYFTVSRMADDYDHAYEYALGLGAPPLTQPTAVLAAKTKPGKAIHDLADDRLRVVYFVSPSSSFAGIERVVHEIATGLSLAHGSSLEVHVVFASHYDDPLLHEPAYTRHTLGVNRLNKIPAVLRRTIKKIRPDVVVFPQVEASVIGWTSTLGLGIPLFVSHLHGNPRVEEREGTKRTRAAFAVFRHIVSPRIAGVLAVSPSLAQYAQDSFGSGVPVQFAPNPVRSFQPSERSNDGNNPFHFVNVARLSRQKGQDILLRGLALARADLPAVRLTLVGDGPQAEELKQLSKDLGLDDIVTFTGFVNDPSSYLESADCFVFASRWEGFGVALVEALDRGLPLLATDCEFGPADLITDDRIGYLVETESPEAIADGLRRSAHRTSTDEDIELRRTTAAQYARESACEQHYEWLTELAGRNALRENKLAKFVFNTRRPATQGGQLS